jgi:hypothetical protein
VKEPNAACGCNLQSVTRRRGSVLIHVAKFALLSGVILFVAWLAGTGRVGYVMVMLWIAAALGYAVVDLVDYEIVKRNRRG